MNLLTFSAVLIVCVAACSAHNYRTILVNPAPYPILRYRSTLVSPGMVSYAQQPLILGDPYNYRSLLMPTVLYSGVNTAPTTDDSGIVPVPENFISGRAGSPMTVAEPEPGSPHSEHKPRCLQSLFGWYAKKKVAGVLDSFDPSGPPSLPPPPGLPNNLQGGVIYPNPNAQSSGNPALNHAFQAMKDANIKEGEVNAANSQLNALAGLGASGGYPISFREDIEMEEDGKLKEPETETVTPTEDTKITTPINIDTI